MKVYSPSSTVTFQRCPQLWWWRRQGWESKSIGNPDCAAAVGIGFSKGMELYHRNRDMASHSTLALDAIILDAQYAGMERLQKRLDHGASLVPSVEKTFELIPKRIEKAIRGFHKRHPLPEDWHDFLTERTFPDHGNCRPDMVCRSDLGACIVDFKSKVTAQPFRIDEFMFDAETSWQMMHYVWAARQMGLNVQSFAIVLVVIEPLDFFVEQWLVDDTRLARWIKDAETSWGLMEWVEGRGQDDPDGETWVVPRVGDHRDKYGLCSHYGLCYDQPQHSIQITRQYETAEYA